MSADAAKLLKRCEQLRSRRTVVEDTWRNSYDHTYPLRGVGLDSIGVSGDVATANTSNAAAKQAELLDTTGTDGARILASGLQSGLTPSNSRWPGLELGDESDIEKRWLDESADYLWQNIHASNFDAVSFECMLDMAIAGMFPMFADTGPEGGFTFEEWPLSSTFVACSSPSGAVDTAFNEFPLSAEQAVESYGAHMLSEKTRKLADEKPDEQITFVRCIYPRRGPHGQMARNMPFASVHIEKDSKQIVRESGYHELPLGVPRWQPIPGSAYAYGPAAEALPDLKTLNTVVQYVLSNADLAVAGMWGAVDDGVLNPRTVRVGPRKIIVMAEKDNLWPLQPASKFDIAVLEIDRLQRAIRKIFMADQLEPQPKRAGEQPTATEIVVRVELIRQLLGPIYGRMQSEYLQWLVTRCFGLAFRAGVFAPAPRSILSRAISVTYHSPIARAQKAVDVAAMDRYELALGQQAAIKGEDVLDMYEWDKANRKRAELLGVPADLIPDEDTLAANREAKAQAMQQQNMAAMAAEVMTKQAA